MIGDHTDIFGMDSYMNDIAVPDGLRFEFDAAVDADTNRQIVDLSGPTHPIVRSMQNFLFYTSNSIAPSWTATDVLTSDHLLIDKADMSVNTFSETSGPIPMSG